MFSICTSNSELYNDNNYDDDSGINVYFTEQQILKSKSLSNKVNLNVRCSYSGGSYFLIPRSSISKTPLRMSNSIGLIDSGYSGDLITKLDNLSDEDFIIERGMSLFQIISPDLKKNKVRFVDEEAFYKLYETRSNRGNKGFGSTG